MQEQIRRRFQKFIEESGLKQNFVAKNLNISPVELCNYKKGKTDLDNVTVVKLDQLMQKWDF
ncbi:helix-turn-helix domain-containing protein [Caproiciproducens sp.]